MNPKQILASLALGAAVTVGAQAVVKSATAAPVTPYAICVRASETELRVTGKAGDGLPLQRSYVLHDAKLIATGGQPAPSDAMTKAAIDADAACRIGLATFAAKVQ